VNRAQGSDFSLGFGNGNCNGLGVDIKTDKCMFFMDRFRLQLCAVRYLDLQA
jgi:hypothetical protein